LSFIHLHTHSEYSLLEASSGVKDMVKKAKSLGMPALALTDLGNMFGAVEFYFACKEQGIKPILGLDAYLAPNGRLYKSLDRNEIQKPLGRIVLLATSKVGYQNLARLSSIGYQEGFYYKPRIDLDVLKESHEDLIALTGGLRGEVAVSFFHEGPEKAKTKLLQLRDLFPGRLYVEICRQGLPEQEKLNSFLIGAARELSLPLVATNDVYYLEREDQTAQEVLVCIGTNKTLQDESRFKLGSDQFYFRSAEEMERIFRDIPEAITNTLAIADQVNFEIKTKDAKGKPIYYLPSYPTQEGRSLAEEIAAQSQKGLEQRWQEADLRGEGVSETGRATYLSRLTYELSVIDRMGFNGYFLIVADFINWAKQNGIPVGPGRGSGAGSLVAYALRITDLDPMPYDLLFERFLNPERISMPDFDIDFCQDRRGEVIRYVTEKYGAGSVAQIITYGKLQCRAAIKDVGRVLGMTFPEVDAVTKLVPDKLNISIDEAIETEPRLRELMEMSPQVATLIDLARRVEGLVRHAGIHAAGVIIADDQLIKHSPLYRGADGENVVQYDMKHAEKIGLIKFDFLGLKTLTHIHTALQLIKKNRGKEITSNEISLNDPGIYTIMGRGDTAGIFQFEGEGITDAIRQIKPTSFFDITAINALYRPGPMAMIPEYAKRKNGEATTEYLFDELKDVLAETYGIIVYQEQVMAIASKIAGYSLGEADMLRRAMGKKIKEEMDRHRERFLKGAAEKGFEIKKSEELFELMYKFADYGFNKSHAAAYCVIAAQTAWLKNYYPAEFFAALLSTELSDTDKVVKYVKDAQRRGLAVKPPHVNFSDFSFTVKQDEIYFGLGAIKGVGESAISSVLQARGSGDFKDLNDFFERVDTKKLNKKVIECLIKAGAFDGLGAHRAQLLEGYSVFLERADVLRRDREVGQGSFFDLAPEKQKVVLPEVKPWSKSQALRFEKEVLGFYISDHPMRGLDQIARLWTTGLIASMEQVHSEHESKSSTNNNKQKYDFRNRDGNRKRVVILGLVQELRELVTKKGTRMAFAKVEDLSGSIELIVFPDAFSQFEGVLKSDEPMIVGGYLDKDKGALKIIADNIVPWTEALKKVKRLVINLQSAKDEDLLQVAKVLRDFPGSSPIELHVPFPDLDQKLVIEPEEISGVNVTPELIESLLAHLHEPQLIEMRT
jgi:DNA polymerase-3 subunit alpha